MNIEAIAEIGNGEFPERDELLSGAVRFSPPKPVAIKLMIGPENDGHNFPVLCTQAVGPAADAPQNLLVLLVCAAPWNDCGNCRLRHVSTQ